MSQLIAFEAAVRCSSFTAAAEELSITQSAVSRQIRLLEEQVGCQLFVRKKRTQPSEAGLRYADIVREAMKQIANASISLHANPNGGSLNLAILPTFGTRWLAPRLPLFLRDHPGITINLSTRLSPFDFMQDSCDAAIHYGVAPWDGTEGVELMSETIVPVCSPEFSQKHPISSPSDLIELPLLHLQSRPDQWSKWFATFGLEVGHVRGMVFDQFAIAAQASAVGLGVALLPTFLVRDDIKRGDLVPIVDYPIVSAEKYYLIWPIQRAMSKPLASFRNWLVHESGIAEDRTSAEAAIS